MALINEIELGTYAKYNGMTMYRKYDGIKGVIPYFRFVDDNTLSMDSNIVVNYIELFKNSDGDEVVELRRYKYYIVPNIVTEYYNLGETLPTGFIATGGQVVPGSEGIDQNGDYYATYYSTGEEVAEGTKAIGNEVKVKAWHAANNWFLNLARTPITADIGIMDNIEYILAGLPMEIPNGYILQSPN